MKTSLIAIAAIGTLATAAPALAGGITIEYRDLNLATVEGQKALDYRIDKAARKACGYDRLNTGSRVVRADVKKCYAQAKKAAKRQMAAIVENESLGG